MIAAVLISASLGIISAASVISPMTTQLSSPRNWIIVACDVGQGDALLVRDPNRPGEVILVDTGDDAEALSRCLRAFGVERIALLVLTHDDRDHIGALDSVLPRVDVALISPTLLGERTEQRPLVRMLQAAATPYRVGAAGDGGSSEGDGLSWRVLAPTPTAVPAESNAASLVLLLEVQKHRLLLLADTGFEEQAELVRQTPLSDIDVVKVAHHGSRDQDPALIDSVSATWGLVSVGAANRYGHPNEATLSSLARAGTRTLRTDLYGSIALVQQPDGSLAPWVEYHPEQSDRPSDDAALEG